MNVNGSRSRSTNSSNNLSRLGSGGIGPWGSGTTNSKSPVKYVYDLPYFERKELCRILDENNQWEALGGMMGYSVSELSEFGRAVYRGASSTDSLLTAWGSQNHTILELFTLLAKLHHYRGMRVIQNFVDPKYHAFIKDPNMNVTAELIQVENPPQVDAKCQHSPDKVKPGEEGREEVKKNLLSSDEQLTAGAAAESVGLLPQIPYEELLLATENWERRNILGKGGFGTVYRGIWKNTPVAIKRMEQRTNQAFIQSQLRQSIGELRFLNAYRHDNILPLYGFCLEGEHPCLVYQYMNNGSLEDRLLCRQRTYPLNWTLRYSIARGVACGIQFLHSIRSTPLIHGDIKSANILLDKNFEAKVGDFGLAREMNPTSDGASYVKVSRVHGTRPYLPDEYLRSKKLSTKVDTFSFGIMLYEVVAGQRAYEDSRPKKFLKDIFEDAENVEALKDPKGGSENPDIFWILVRQAKLCTQRIAKERPPMVTVLKSLDGSMSQASIRTVSSHVTGLPLLFDQTQSLRPGSFMPTTGTTTNARLSPVDMRTSPSPQWVPPHPTVQQIQTPSLQRRSPIPYNASPIPTPPLTLSQPNSIPEEAPSNTNSATSNNRCPQLSESPVTSYSPKSHRASIQPTTPTPLAMTQVPEPRLSAIISDDQYLPLVLQPSRCEESEDIEEPMTVIPLITELGIKDKTQT